MAFRVAGVRIPDQASRRVGPPTSKDQCKHGGWQTFNNPSFKNQGQCVKYAVHAHKAATKSHGHGKKK